MSNQFPGDFSLREVNLYPHNGGEPINIKNLVLEITLYESILSSNLQATLTIEDVGQNLISTLPIVGQERIQIIIASDNQFYNLNYYLYKIDGRSMKEKEQVYVMSCVSIEALRNENFRICERVDGKKAEEIIPEILKRDGFSTKTIQKDKDETVHPFDMYVPNWRVFDYFNWLSTRSVPEYKQDSIGFLFYETFNGFNFRSIDRLIDQPTYPAPNVKYTFFQGNTKELGRVDANDKYRINNFSYPKAFNIYEDMRRGAFSHASIYVDVTRRTYRSYKTTVDDYWKDMSHLEKVKPYTTVGPVQLLNRPSRFIYRPSTISTWGWQEDLSDAETDNVDDMNKLFEKAWYRYYFLEYITIDISVPGDLKNRVGNVIYISIPDPKRSSENSVQEDKSISGRYIINSIKHTILNRSELRTNIALTRDTYLDRPVPNPIVSGERIFLDGTN